MQIKIFNKDGTFFKNLDKAEVVNISKKNGGVILTDEFEDIISKYISFEQTGLLSGGNTENRFTLGIVGDYSIVNNKYQYKTLDILDDFKRGHIIGGGTTQTGTFAAITGVIITHYQANNSGINVFNNISETVATVNTFYYTLKFNTFEALDEVKKQILATYTYRYKFLNENVINSIDLEFGNSGTIRKLYSSKGNIGYYITNLSYSLSLETLANYIYVFDSAGTLVTTLVDSTSITNYGKRVKVLKLDTADGSEAGKGQQYFDKYKNPYPIIKNLEIAKNGNPTVMNVGDEVKIMSEGTKEALFVNTSFLIEDIIYNGKTDTYNLIIGDIINNTYLK